MKHLFRSLEIVFIWAYILKAIKCHNFKYLMCAKKSIVLLAFSYIFSDGLNDDKTSKEFI